MAVKDRPEPLLINLFKNMSKEEKEEMTVYYSPKYQVYIFEHKDGGWGIGSSLGEGKGFLYWHSKLGKFVMNHDFNLENLLTVLERDKVVRVGN